MWIWYWYWYWYWIEFRIIVVAPLALRCKCDQVYQYITKDVNSHSIALQSSEWNVAPKEISVFGIEKFESIYTEPLYTFPFCHKIHWRISPIPLRHSIHYEKKAYQLLTANFTCNGISIWWIESNHWSTLPCISVPNEGCFLQCLLFFPLSDFFRKNLAIKTIEKKIGNFEKVRWISNDLKQSFLLNCCALVSSDCLLFFFSNKSNHPHGSYHYRFYINAMLWTLANYFR